jgi:tRNA pseudouridine38-40 synthase
MIFFRIKCTVEYDGSGYFGFQKQKDQKFQTIQSVIEDSLSKIFQKNIDIFVAGRTDSSVHAEAQVFHFDILIQDLKKFVNFNTGINDNNLLSSIKLKIISAINSFLNYKNISILDIEIFKLKTENYDLYIKKNLINENHFTQNININEKKFYIKIINIIDYFQPESSSNFDFHSRFSAKEKTYTYKIINRKQPLGLYSKYFWHISYDLPLLNYINEISSVLVGEHDFSSFRSKFCSSPKTIRTINFIKAYVYKKNLEPFEYEIHFKINAKSFLHNQVRLMIGTIMHFLKLQKITKEDAIISLKEILDSKKRSMAKEKAPAHGLYLSEIKY